MKICPRRKGTAFYSLLHTDVTAGFEDKSEGGRAYPLLEKTWTDVTSYLRMILLFNFQLF